MRPLTASMYARLNVERTHTRETRGSRFLNNAHVLYRKCLFLVRMKYSARTYRIEWKLHALPPPRFIMHSCISYRYCLADDRTAFSVTQFLIAAPTCSSLTLFLKCWLLFQMPVEVSCALLTVFMWTNQSSIHGTPEFYYCERKLNNCIREVFMSI